MDPSKPWFWLLVFGSLITVVISPTVIALIRQVDGIGIVIIVNALALVTLLALPIAWWAAFALPRRLPPLPPYDPARRPPLPPRSIEPNPWAVPPNGWPR